MWLDVNGQIKSVFVIPLPAGRINGYRKLRNIPTFSSADLANALFLDLIDTHNGMHGDVGPLNAFEL